MAWGTVAALRDRNARVYLAGVIVSGFGNSAMALTSAVWIRTLTGSNGLAAVVSCCVWLPSLAGPALGPLTDRVPRRALLVATNLALAGLLLAPAGLRTAGGAWLLFAVMTLVGTGAVLTDAAETALVAEAVPEPLRGDFNGLLRTALESMKLLAPPLGAGLFAAFGGRAVALLDAASFALAAGAFARIRLRGTAPERRAARDSRVVHGRRPGGGPGPDGGPHPDGGPRTADGRSWGAEIAEGARHLWRHRTLRPLVLAGGSALVASSLSSTATFALLQHGLHRPPAYAGVLTPPQGLGSMVSGLAAGALLRRIPERAFAAGGPALFALGALARTTPWLPVVLAGGAAIGLGLPCPLIAAFTAVQRETPGHLLGRVAATANAVVFAPAGPALLLGSAAVATLDYRVQLAAAAGAALAAAVALGASVRGGAGASSKGVRKPLRGQEADDVQAHP